MKKFLLCWVLFGIFQLPFLAYAQTTYTPNLNLALPPAAPGTWCEQYNNNFSTLDTVTGHPAHERNPRLWPFNPDALTVPIRPQRQSGLQRFLGALWDYIGPAEAWAGSETEPFTAADSSDLGANWTAYDDGSGLVPCRISNNAAAGTTTAVRCYEGFSHYLPTANQYVEVTLFLDHES